MKKQMAQFFFPEKRDKFLHMIYLEYSLQSKYENIEKRYDLESLLHKTKRFFQLIISVA